MQPSYCEIKFIFFVNLAHSLWTHNVLQLKYKVCFRCTMFLKTYAIRLVEQVSFHIFITFSYCSVSCQDCWNNYRSHWRFKSYHIKRIRINCNVKEIVIKWRNAIYIYIYNKHNTRHKTFYFYFIFLGIVDMSSKIA